MQNSIKFVLASLLVGTIGMAVHPQASYGVTTAPVASSSKVSLPGSVKPKLVSKASKIKAKKATKLKIAKKKHVVQLKKIKAKTSTMKSTMSPAANIKK